MKKLILLLLLITLSCNKDSSSTSGKNTPSQSGESDSSVVTNPDDGNGNDSGNDSGTPAPVPETWTNQFMDLVNDHRRSIGLRSIIHSDGLEDIARQHSVNMANGSVAFGHTGFSSRCSEGRSVLGGGNWCGENVAAGQKTPQAAFTSWMNSSGHRANIESSKATHTGFGYAKNSSGKYYWTQIFIQN